MLDITQNNGENAGVFTATQDTNQAGVLHYEWKNEDTFNISHTEVDPAFSGSGIGKDLVSAAVDFARKKNKKITATCVFAKSVLDKDSSTHDVYSAG